MNQVLIAYFSATGVTRAAAERLAAVGGCDIYEIQPKVPYEKKDLNWMNPFSRSTKEMKGKAPHPEIVMGDIDISRYDTIFIGFPIWWFVAPAIIHSFLEAYDFCGKRIVLFATSGGSGFGKTLQDLQPAAPGAQMAEGMMLNGTLTDEALNAFVERFAK